MSFTRIRIINGRRYLYQEERWREGVKVRSRSRSLGPMDGSGRKLKRGRGGLLAFLHAQQLSPEDLALAVAEREAARVDKYQRDHFGETASERAEREREELLAKLHEAYGLRLGPSNPTPVEPQVAQAAPETKEGPAEAGPVDAPSEDSE
jgi:hypothetical protein